MPEWKKKQFNTFIKLLYLAEDKIKKIPNWDISWETIGYRKKEFKFIGFEFFINCANLRPDKLQFWVNSLVILDSASCCIIFCQYQIRSLEKPFKIWRRLDDDRNFCSYRHLSTKVHFIEISFKLKAVLLWEFCLLIGLF